MQSGWQDVVAIGVIAIAVGYLCRRIWSGRHPSVTSGCGGGCQGCTAADLPTNTDLPANPQQIIPIESLRTKRSSHREPVAGKL